MNRFLIAISALLLCVACSKDSDENKAEEPIHAVNGDTPLSIFSEGKLMQYVHAGDSLVIKTDIDTTLFHYGFATGVDMFYIDYSKILKGEDSKNNELRITDDWENLAKNITSQDYTFHWLNVKHEINDSAYYFAISKTPDYNIKEIHMMVGGRTGYPSNSTITFYLK